VKKYVSNTPKVGHLLSYNGVSQVPDFQWLAREVDQEECMHSDSEYGDLVSFSLIGLDLMGYCEESPFE
jgi:hypothetical protein